MSEQHPKVKKLREFNRWRRGADTSMPNPRETGDLIDWAISVCESADRLVHGKGRNPEKNYGRLEEVIKAE